MIGYAFRVRGGSITSIIDKRLRLSILSATYIRLVVFTLTFFLNILITFFKDISKVYNSIISI